MMIKSTSVNARKICKTLSLVLGAFSPALLLTLIVTSVGFTSFAARKANAADLRIATVDVARLLNESKDAKNRKSELDSASLEAKKKIDGKIKEVRDLEAKVRDAKAAEDSSEMEGLREKARVVSRLKKDLEDELRQKFIKTNKTLTEQALTVIQEYAEENNIDLVLDKNSQERGPVLFGLPKIDITDGVVKRLNS